MTIQTDALDGWWASLQHEGLLIAPGKLIEHFGQELEPLPSYLVDRLRGQVNRVLDDGDNQDLGGLLDIVLEQLLGLDKQRWRKANQVGSNWSHDSVTGGAIRPRRLWEGPRDEILPVFTIERGSGSLRVGRGRKETSRVVEWLRKANRPLALLTNGVQLRLIHAGPDYVAQCEWDVQMWFEEGRPSVQVTALRQLLRREVLKKPNDEHESPLIQAIVESRRAQGELSAVLGERVRQAVEKSRARPSRPCSRRKLPRPRLLRPNRSTSPRRAWSCAWWSCCSAKPAASCPGKSASTTTPTASRASASSSTAPPAVTPSGSPRAMARGRGSWRCFG